MKGPSHGGESLCLSLVAMSLLNTKLPTLNDPTYLSIMVVSQVLLVLGGADDYHVSCLIE
jgi:UDP-N-acetylmuramyl pentapeptide phosphotransferase/UDP-N-acetylglucosamine-1-phosphate transferase